MFGRQKETRILNVEDSTVRLCEDTVSYSIGLRTDKGVDFKYISKELHDLLVKELDLEKLDEDKPIWYLEYEKLFKLGYKGKVAHGRSGTGVNMKSYLYIRFLEENNSRLIEGMISNGWEKITKYFSGTGFVEFKKYI